MKPRPPQGVLRTTLGVLSLGIAACYSSGDGTAPPPKDFYFPVGMAVSRGGNVLYVANSDFDLQWNGGTVQSYDLHLIRTDTALAIVDPTNPSLPLQRRDPAGACPSNPPVTQSNGTGFRQPIGETCAPPVFASAYVRDSVIIGAFATDLQISKPSFDVNPPAPPSPPRPSQVDRLFLPVRGDASLTWMDVASDVTLDPTTGKLVSKPIDPSAPYPPFALDCGVRVRNRCDGAHHAGNNPDEPNNTRKITMPGEPFGMALSEDQNAIAVTHQNDTKTSLLSSGLSCTRDRNSTLFCDPSPSRRTAPALQFVVDGLPTGGNGITAVPHDPNAFDPSTPAPRPAFLQTSRTTAELDLLRFYSDQGLETGSSLSRPYIIKEATFPLTANAGGSDSRGIVIDPTPRIACELAVAPAGTGRTPRDVEAERVACARLPARVFFANRSPASLLIGEIGEPALAADGSYDADRLVIYGNVPLSFGPSRLYLAPIVDRDGNYALRVFIVCFDSATIYIYDPEAAQVENIIHVGAGPFAMAFDPFSLADVATRAPVPLDPRDSTIPHDQSAPRHYALRSYNFAYVASFTNSFVQVIDLNNAQPDKSTFENVVYTLGSPTAPKGSQ